MAMTFREKDERIRRAEEALLGEIAAEPRTTKSLVLDLRARAWDDYSIRAAMWGLIGRGQAELLKRDAKVWLAKTP